jgi:deoxyribodipyrimidine photo-lyase
MKLSQYSSREGGLAALAAFLPYAGLTYTQNRNFDFGQGRRTNVSRLSPFLRFRLISEQEVILSVLTQYSSAEADKFIQEVFWRSYWKGWLELRPSVWRDYLQSLEAQLQIYEARTELVQATQGNTGIDCFDYWVRELRNTGYLHNHARMWFASIWYFYLGLPWELGSDFFLHHLLDADAASNTLSWRWVVGLQTPGKRYIASSENIRRFTEGRFRANLPQPLEFSVVFNEHPAPTPLLNLPSSTSGRCVLLLTEDDLSWYEHVEIAPAKVIIIRTETGCSVTLPSELVGRHKELLHEELNQTLATRFIAPVDLPPDPHVLLAATEAYRDLPIVLMKPLVGFLQSPLLQCLERVSEVQRVIQLRRPWDNALFPKATAGFFRFIEKNEEVLEGVRSGVLW